MDRVVSRKAEEEAMVKKYMTMTSPRTLSEIPQKKLDRARSFIKSHAKKEFSRTGQKFAINNKSTMALYQTVGGEKGFGNGDGYWSSNDDLLNKSETKASARKQVRKAKKMMDLDSPKISSPLKARLEELKNQYNISTVEYHAMKSKIERAEGHFGEAEKIDKEEINQLND